MGGGTIEYFMENEYHSVLIRHSFTLYRKLLTIIISGNILVQCVPL